MRLVHPREVASVKGARAGFTVLEVLLALSLTVVVIGVMLGGVVAFTRANTAATALESLNVTAKVLENYLQRDLRSLSRALTFTRPGSCPETVPATAHYPPATRLWLLDEYVSWVDYYVDYAWDPEKGLLHRAVDLNAPDAIYRRFENVAHFHIDCLRGGQVVATALLRERLPDGDARAGQQVEVRVSSAVRMR